MHESRRLYPRWSVLFLFAALATAAPATAQVCGDCNQDGATSVLDALRQASINVGLIVSTPADLPLCDTDDDNDIDILDALKVAQVSSGLPIALTCPIIPIITTVTALTGPTTGTNSVPIAGGETVELFGAGFKSGATVTIGASVLATAFVDPTLITFTSPVAAADLLEDVTVTNPNTLAGTLVDGIFFTQEFSLAPQPDTLTRAQAAHLYRRAAFGGSSLQINAAIASGLAATVNNLVNFTNNTAVEAAAISVYGGATGPQPFLDDAVNKRWWLHLMLENPNPFQERLAWFLHDHFAISEQQMAGEFRWTMHIYTNLLRRFSVSSGDTLYSGEAGLNYDWRAILVAMSKQRAMLDWLSGNYSFYWAPNENYAREFWELFSLGEGQGYTENDIREAAKAFTGFFWYYTGGPMGGSPLEERYRPQWHHTGLKTVFGVSGFFGYDDLAPFYETDPGPPGNPQLGTTDPSRITDPVDIDGGIVALTLAQRPVEASRHICRKLLAFFVYDNPNDVVVNALASSLRAPGPNQWNLRPIITTILQSQAMFSQTSIKSQLKNPVDFSIGFLRTTGIDLSPVLATNVERLRQRLIAMDMVPLAPPNVAGWPAGPGWIHAQGMLARFNFLSYTIDQLDSITQILPLVPSPRASITPTTLVDSIALMLDVDISASVRTACIDYVSTDLVGGVPTPVPFDPMNDTRLRMKTRGLLWIIGQQHSGHQE